MGGFVAQSNCAMLIEAQGMTEAKSVKARDKKTNWAECNGALNKARGSLPIWLNKDMQGYASASGKRGGAARLLGCGHRVWPAHPMPVWAAMQRLPKEGHKR